MTIKFFFNFRNFPIISELALNRFDDFRFDDFEALNFWLHLIKDFLICLKYIFWEHIVASPKNVAISIGIILVLSSIVFIFTFSAFYKTSGSSLGSSGSVFEIQKQNLIKNFVSGTRFCGAWFPDTIFSSIQFLYFGFYIPLHRVLFCILYFSEHPPLRVLNRGSLIPLHPIESIFQICNLV